MATGLGTGEAAGYSDWCRHHPVCTSCPRAVCIHEHTKEYMKRRLAVDETRLRELRAKPRCTLPGCRDDARYYAWNDAERVLDGYCEEHQDYARGGYYDGHEPLIST